MYYCKGFFGLRKGLIQSAEGESKASKHIVGENK